MKRVFVTGSADGLGLAAAEALIAQGHRVVVHVRSEARRAAVRHLKADVVVGDLGDVEQTRSVADQVNALGTMDAVIHNAGVYSSGPVMQVNVFAPYVLTALINKPQRLIYLSSGMHVSGRKTVNGSSYSDSKLLISTFAAALAKRWPDVITSSVNPGWVPTKMGGSGAPDDLELGHVTQVWLATSDDAEAKQSDHYWFHQRRAQTQAAVNDTAFQKEVLEHLARVTGTPLPS
ncbi:MAG: SDR family NAD(P)-dependent oxidoreductase [Archangium sp.]